MLVRCIDVLSGLRVFLPFLSSRLPETFRVSFLEKDIPPGSAFPISIQLKI